MEDNEIINALETCERLLNYDTYTYKAVKRGLDLINRQKAEIERLKNELHGRVEYIHEQQEVINDLKDKYNKKGLTVEVTFDKEQLEKIAQECMRGYKFSINEVRNGGIKDFAEEIEKELMYNTDNNGDINSCFVPDIIHRLVKEMTEG